METKNTMAIEVKNVKITEVVVDYEGVYIEVSGRIERKTIKMGFDFFLSKDGKATHRMQRLDRNGGDYDYINMIAEAFKYMFIHDLMNAIPKI